MIAPFLPNYCGRDWTNRHEFLVVMAWEAFRLAMTGTTEKFPPRDVIRWLRITSTEQGTDA